MSMRISRKSHGEVHRRDDDRAQAGSRVHSGGMQSASSHHGIHRMGSGFDANRTTSATTTAAQRTGSTGEQPRAGWSAETPHLQQPKGSDDCGATSIAMLMRAAGKGGGKTNEQLISELDASTGGNGMTPHQLGETLAKNGLHVAGAGRSMSPEKMKEAFAQGYKFIAKVNTERLDAASKGPLERLLRGKGGSHYVVVDGMDDKGRLIVKDPQSSTTRTLTPEQLDYAMGSDKGLGGAISSGMDALFRGGTMRGGLMAIRPDENALQKWQDGVVDDQIAAGMHMNTDPGGGYKRRLPDMF